MKSFARGLTPVLLLLVAGCALGPRSIERDRLRYNEAVKATTEEQLLLNIVRLRYTDTPSSLAITGIADQREVAAGLSATPFFTSAAAGNAGTYRGALLPQGELSGADRPTLSYTPLDDEEFTRRLFTPISLEGVSYLAKTTWPISTVFRLYLENLNWVSNAETASGPTPRDPPEFARFLAGVTALQRLQDRKAVTLYSEEREEPLADGDPGGVYSPTAAVEAAKAGFEYHKRADGGWAIVKKKVEPVLRADVASDDDPDWAAFCDAFRLDRRQRRFDLTAEKLDPYLAGSPPEGVTSIDVETRSLLQVLFFVSHGVEVPPPHVASGLAPMTFGPDGQGFDWDQVLGGLFKVCWAEGEERPPCAHVAIRYRGYWFYIDERDRDTKATFSLLVELSRLELGAAAGDSGPILTLPLGGR